MLSETFTLASGSGLMVLDLQVNIGSSVDHVQLDVERSRYSLRSSSRFLELRLYSRAIETEPSGLQTVQTRETLETCISCAD